MSFALSATPTAGTGTISIAANSYTVVGVGTNFTGQNLVGKIILLSGHNALVTAVATNTSMTINRAAAYAITSTSFSFANSDLRIDQSGTDTNLNGLASIIGVTPLYDGANPLIRSFDIGSIRLYITGNLTIPDGYWLRATGGAAGNALTVGVNGKLVIDARVTVVRNGESIITYSLSCGIIIRKQSGIPYSVNTVQFDSGAQFEQYGGILESSGAVRWTSSTTSIAKFRNAIWYILDRNSNGYMNIYFNLSKIDMDGLKIFSNGTANPGFLNALDAGYSIKGYECTGGLNCVTAIDGTTALVRLDNFVGGSSRADFQVRNGGTVTSEIDVGGYDFYNSNLGNDLYAATNATASNTRGRARAYISYTAKFQDPNTLASIEGGVLYLKDSNSGNRQLTNGVTSDKIYIATTDSFGELTSIDILTKVWSGLGVNPMSEDNRLPASGYFWAYGYKGNPVNVISSLGPQTPLLYPAIDENVTLTKAQALVKLASSFTIDLVLKKITVIQDSNYDDLYDCLTVFKCSADQTILETPTINNLIINNVNRTLIAADDWNLTVQTAVTLTQGVKANKIKFTSITQSGTGKITGLYETQGGASARIIFSNLT